MILPRTTIDAITLFVEDPQRSKRFYQAVFGLSPVYESPDAVGFRFANIEVNLLAVTTARHFVSPGVIAARETGCRFQFTIEVENIDLLCADLVGHGVELLHAPTDRDWGFRVASFEDPDGHIWELAQPIK